MADLFWRQTSCGPVLYRRAELPESVGMIYPHPEWPGFWFSRMFELKYAASPAFRGDRLHSSAKQAMEAVEEDYDLSVGVEIGRHHA